MLLFTCHTTFTQYIIITLKKFQLSSMFQSSSMFMYLSTKKFMYPFMFQFIQDGAVAGLTVVAGGKKYMILFNKIAYFLKRKQTKDLQTSSSNFYLWISFLFFYLFYLYLYTIYALYTIYIF